MIRKLLVILFTVGICFSLYPFVTDMIDTYKHNKVIKDFNNENIDSNKLKQLKNDMIKYNEKIYKNHQNDLKDPFSYQDEVFSLEDYNLDSIFGYITIDKMNISLPLYLGANEKNMSLGATILGQTSMPIGTTNSNTVIAAHRGYRGSPYFRNIEELEIGDKVVINNYFGEYTYKVYKTVVLKPTDIEAIKIQKGHELVTLITCHPYTKNYQRYVVYCIRDNDNSKISNLDDLSSLEYQSSSNDILKEKYISVSGLLISICLLIILIKDIIKNKKS